MLSFATKRINGTLALPVPNPFMDPNRPFSSLSLSSFHHDHQRNRGCILGHSCMPYFRILRIILFYV